MHLRIKGCEGWKWHTFNTCVKFSLDKYIKKIEGSCKFDTNLLRMKRITFACEEGVSSKGWGCRSVACLCVSPVI